jgi:hypothetical protein
MTYKNAIIERLGHSGMYSAFIAGFGYLRADSLEGVKKLVDFAAKNG